MTQLDESKIAKVSLLNAQAQRAISEANLFDVEAVLHEAQLVITRGEADRQAHLLREAEADAASAKIRLEIAKQSLEQERHSTTAARIQADELLRIEQNYLASNVANHVVTFSDDITDDTVRQCISLLTVWDRREPSCDIEIIFDCNGGEAWAGLHLFDYLVHLGKTHEVIITAIGKTASMAAILVQAATRRRMGANSMMMLHELSAGTSGKLSEQADQMDLLRKIEKNIKRLIAERSNITESQLTTLWKKKDIWLDAQECLAKGLIDEIM